MGCLAGLHGVPHTSTSTAGSSELAADAAASASNNTLGKGDMPPGVYACVGTVGSDSAWRAGQGGCSAPSSDWDRTQRRYLLVVPPRPQRPAPLVLLAPGSDCDPSWELEITELTPLAAKHGFAAVVLQGEEDSLNVAKEAMPGDGADDVAFTLAAARHAHTLLPGGVDPRRVFCTGHSRGARFCSMLGARLPALVAAIAPHSGLRFPLAPHGTRPVPVLAFHGLADTVNPFYGGGAEYWNTSVPDAVQRWAAFNRCNGTATTRLDHGVSLEVHSGCLDGADVQLYTSDGAGHTWFGQPWKYMFTCSVGRIVSHPKASPLLWRFFEEHPLPLEYAPEALALLNGPETLPVPVG